MTDSRLASPTGISVVIPTLNRPMVLLDTLRDIAAQDFINFEVIVIDQSGEPNFEVLDLSKKSTFPLIYKHVTHFRGAPEARNYGWRLAKFEIVLFLDDDIRCSNNLLSNHFLAHKKTKMAMIAGGISEAKGDVTKPGKPGTWNMWTCTPVRNFHLKEEGACFHGGGGNFSFQKTVLEALGGFDEGFNVGSALFEESEISFRMTRAGYSAWFYPAAHVTHLAAPSGGTRQLDVSRYVFGMAHNRSIVIFRYLSPVQKITATVRTLMYGVSFSLRTQSPTTFFAAVRGIKAGMRVATLGKKDTHSE